MSKETTEVAAENDDKGGYRQLGITTGEDEPLAKGEAAPEEEKKRNSLVKKGEPKEPDDDEIHVPLDADTYGAALFSIVTDLSCLFGGVNSDGRPVMLRVTRIIFVNMVLFANYFLQFGMLHFIKTFVVDPQKEVQAASGVESLLDVLVRSHPAFLGVVLVLWTLTILIELRKVEGFISALNSLKTAASLHDMIFPDHDSDGNETWEIKGLTKPVYWSIMIVITVPKVSIVIWLFLMGFDWLSSTVSPQNLILNALALAFVVNIDEQLFEALIPTCLKDKMQHVTLCEMKKMYATEEEEHESIIQAEWASFRRSILYFFLPILVSLGYIYYMQGLLADKVSGLGSDEE
jgi:hypothetical protein